MAGDAPGRGELAGREQELAELRGRWSAALAGHGTLALVTGPPGIGKTRLAEELAGQARRDGHRVLWGRGVEDQGAPPLWMWRRILGAVGGDDAWDQLTGDAAADGARSDDLTAARYRAAAAAADAITAAADQDGLLVVLEDLHWADQASLFLLRELAAELPQSRLLVLATSREATDGPARAALGDLARLPGLHMLRLGALDEAALAGILRAAGVTVTPELARVVRAHAGGNPLYVTTLARLLVTEPGGPLDEHTLARIVGGSAEVSGLVRSLLRGLDDEACAVLAAASVLGEAFDPALVAAVGPESGEVLRALAAAEHRGLASPAPGRPGAWRFTHALVRDGIYAGIPEDQRIGLHQRAAAALEPLARRAPGRGAEVAGHLLRAAPGPAALRQAARWATAAADAATRALAFEDAARYLATALAAADGAGADGAGGGRGRGGRGRRRRGGAGRAAHRAGYRRVPGRPVRGQPGPLGRRRGCRRAGLAGPGRCGGAGGARGRAPGRRHHTGGAVRPGAGGRGMPGRAAGPAARPASRRARRTR